MSNDNSHHNTGNTVGIHNINSSSNDGHSCNTSKINISQQNQNLQQNNQKMPLSRSLTQPQGTIEYVVAANDTITSVAARFHTTPSELARINRRSGHFIFPGQVLFVPKSLSADNVEFLDKQQQKNSSVPPNTPNDPLLSQSPSHVIQSSNANINEPSSSSIDNLNPVPGHAERVVDAIANINIKADNNSTKQPLPPSHLFDDKLVSIYNQQHHPLNHTASEPVHIIPATPELGAGKEITEMAPTASSSELIQKPHTTSAVNTIDPADRECLERFLKINVRYITDGQGVVSGVLLVTPNAMMFDANVSDPLVMEHGPEMYNVTIPIDLVLKTALYSDIAHMRVKHAPEAVPSVPKPSVYYASDEDAGGIVEENLKNVYAKKKTAFDTISKVSEEEKQDDDEQQQDESKQETENMNTGQISGKIVEKKISTDDDEEFKDAVEHQVSQENYKKNVNNQNTIINNNKNENNKICDEVHNKNNINDDNHSNHNETDSDVNIKKENEQNNKRPNDSKVIQQTDSTESSSINSADNQQSIEINSDDQLKKKGIEEEEEESSSMKFFEDDSINSQKRSDFKIVESVDDDQATSIDQSLDLMTSVDDNDLLNLSSTLPTPPLSATDHQQFQKKKHSPQLVKMSLGERHSAPSQANHHKNLSNRSQIDEHKPLQSAISAEETCSDPSPLRHQRLSAAGENRRGQMLKRLSNPVDALGNLTKSGISSGINATKSGFNATKTGLSKGLNATQSGITTGYQATKSGLTTGLSVTKTGFNKVLATPKNLMDFSSGLVRDAKGALAPTASKSDINLQEHLDSSSSGGGSFDESSQPQQQSKTKSPMLGYCNMVDKKIDAFENFDKLFPRPARVNKDTPLYLCIRMGKYKKDETKRNQQRFSPTYSFGKKKYEREYWFSVPKDKAKNLYHFFNKWAPEIYGDVDDISGCEQRCLEPITTDDEYDLDDDDNTTDDDNKNSAGGKRQSFHRLSSQDKGSLSLDTANIDDPNMNANVNRQRFWRRSPLHFLKLVEDHFSTDGLSTEWNVSNSSEDHSFHERYHLDIDNNEPIIPELIGPSELLVLAIIQDLSKHLPARAEGYAWTLIYSTSQHGFSLNSLYREMRHFDSPVLLIVEDTNGAKFGALLSHSLRISDHFYGTGETFLFTFHPTFECFPWTGENIFFIKGNVDSIAIGAGEGNFGLWLDGDLYHGTSHPCKTFGNRSLSSDEDFVVKTIECWGFV